MRRSATRYHRNGAGPPRIALRAVLRSLRMAQKSFHTLAVNTSPEPFSNWILSFGEDLLAVWLTWMAGAHPLTAAIVVSRTLLISLSTLRSSIYFSYPAVHRQSLASLWVNTVQAYFTNRVASQSKILCQNCRFCGFSTQWPSSGKTTDFVLYSFSFNIKNSRDYVYGTRKSFSPAMTSVGVLYFPNSPANVEPTTSCRFPDCSTASPAYRALRAARSSVAYIQVWS